MITNKYSNIYFQITDRAKFRILTDYFEKHHIIPKSLGGDDAKDNLVALTAREHFICHWLLTKMTEGVDKSKMIYALNGMKRANKLQERYSTEITSRVYENLKRVISAQHSEFMAGREPPNKGKTFTDEKYKVAGRKNKGRVRDRELVEMIANKIKGQKRSVETKRRISEALTGIKRPKMSEEHKLKRSLALKGRPKPDGFGIAISKRMKEEFVKNNPNKRDDLKKTCPHCQKVFGPSNFTRWHGDKCKMKGK